MARNHYAFVLDCSVTMAWCFEDESSKFTDSILENLQNSNAIVPSIWPLEVSNVLLLSKKNKRINDIQLTSFVDALLALPITIDHSATSRAMHSVFTLASSLDLTIYDAAYLELAIREKIPLITLDKALIKAAKKLHIPIEL